MMGPVLAAPRAVTVADARTGTEHLVTDDGIATGRRAGRYRAVCGELVLAASLIAEPARHCPICLQLQAGRRGGNAQRN